MPFGDAVVELETQLTNALAAISTDGEADRIERFVRLLIRKEIVLKMILMDVNRL